MAMNSKVNYTNFVHSYLDPINGPPPGQSQWQRVSRLAQLSEPAIGVSKVQDFDEITIASNTIGGWAFTSATSGSIAATSTLPNGVVAISAGASTAGQGVNWQVNQPVNKIQTGKDFAISFRAQFTGLTSLNAQLFFGIATVGTTALITSNAVATNIDYIGFNAVTTTGVVKTGTSASSAQSSPGTGFTIANNGWYNFGFYATTSQVDFYASAANSNNQTLVSSITTNIPTGVLAPIIVVQANGTVTPVVNLDYVAWSQIRQ